MAVALREPAGVSGVLTGVEAVSATLALPDSLDGPRKKRVNG